jgi:hypothetical protein
LFFLPGNISFVVYFVAWKLNRQGVRVVQLVTRGIPEDEAKRVFLKSDEMNHRYKKGTMTDDEFWTWAAKHPYGASSVVVT